MLPSDTPKRRITLLTPCGEQGKRLARRAYTVTAETEDSMRGRVGADEVFSIGPAEDAAATKDTSVWPTRPSPDLTLAYGESQSVIPSPDLTWVFADKPRQERLPLRTYATKVAKTVANVDRGKPLDSLEIALRISQKYVHLRTNAYNWVHFVREMLDGGGTFFHILIRAYLSALPFPHRHSRESGNPEPWARRATFWIPAFAGMTEGWWEWRCQ